MARTPRFLKRLFVALKPKSSHAARLERRQAALRERGLLPPLLVDPEKPYCPRRTSSLRPELRRLDTDSAIPPSSPLFSDQWREPLNIKTYDRPSLVRQINGIEDDESRRLTELAYLM